MHPFVETRGWIKRSGKYEKVVVLSLTFVFSTVACFLGFFTSHIPLSSWDTALTATLLTWILINYVTRERIHGRAVTGGMEYSYLIATGLVLIYWSGALLKLVFDIGGLFMPFLLLLMIGVAILFIGLREGPVYGWE